MSRERPLSQGRDADGPRACPGLDACVDVLESLFAEHIRASNPWMSRTEVLMRAVSAFMHNAQPFPGADYVDARLH